MPAAQLTVVIGVIKRYCLVINYWGGMDGWMGGVDEWGRGCGGWRSEGGGEGEVLGLGRVGER